MRELRVYINSSGRETPGEQEVFYSRRLDGPYYRWRYEETLGRWHFSRVHPSRFMLRALCTASWNTVPMTLQTRLDEHYLE